MHDALFDVAGKVVVITGALGQLGTTFGRALLERGATVAAVDLAVPADRVRACFGDAAGTDRVIAVAADVTDRASLEAALAAITARAGVPHALINNAALDSPPNAPAEETGPFETYPLASWEKVLDVNLTGVFLACQVFGGAMAAAGRGSIVNISSIYGLVSPNQTIYEYRRADGAPFFKPVAYAASKSGLLNLTRYLATYWAGAGVRVNAVTFAGVFNNQDARFLESYCAHMPLGRMARAEEYIGPIVFLTSEAASYMTGANLVVDGGWTAW
jgi:NAD(P)-dependent dehydrogenase (short-subunit alcohol dehydrogenase family)